ncbi:molybdopterin-containing oxidoreductase family protein [Candidatus Poriferisodalis sp.]|uniref:molybdopterin-containing oxidoreductase family protein n=1 Tax=Candidatus Poriferisodalis sp. TaxID=3101277 RepID=UPI003B51993C
MSVAETVVRGACHHDCPDTCAWEVTVRDGVAVHLRGDPAHPFTDGQLCPKVNPFLERVYHPDRLLRPLRRTGPKGAGRFSPIDWDVAIAEIADRIGSAVARHGGETVLPYSSDGTQGLVQRGVLADRFFAVLGATRLNRHFCGVTAWHGAADVLGLPLGADPVEITNACTIVLWGTNTLLTNRHMWPFIETARSNGAMVIVVDPVGTMTAQRADWHVQPRPGTDVALVLGLIGVLDRDELIDEARLGASTDDWPELRSEARALGLDEAAAVTGLAATDITRLAHRIAHEQPAVLRALIGMEHREHGRDIHRAVAALAAVAGVGYMRSTQVFFDTALADLAPPSGPQRVVNASALGEVLADVSLDPPVTVLVNYGCNPAVVAPDQNRVIAGLERDDLFTVVIEQFMTDTARYADIVLPATTAIEHLDLMNAWGHLYVSLNLPAIDPVGECLANSEIFRRLACSLELDGPGLADSDEQVARDLLASGHPWLEGITYERLEREGWARLAVPEGWSALNSREVPLSTQQKPDAPAGEHGASRNADQTGVSGDIGEVGDVSPDATLGAAAPFLQLGPLQLGALRYQPATESPGGDAALARRFPLSLMSPKQHQRFLNSFYGGFAHHLPNPPRPRLEISPGDAEARGIAEGDRVRVFNDRGELFVEATITDCLQEGLVTVPFGWWAGDAAGRTVNVLTNAARGGPDPNVGTAAFFDTLVEVKLAPNGTIAADTLAEAEAASEPSQTASGSPS